jgi:hypothetical protein
VALAHFGPARARASAERTWRTVEAAGRSNESLDAFVSSSAAAKRGTHPTRVIWDQTPGIDTKRRRMSVRAAVAVVAGLAVGGAFAWQASSHRPPGAATSERPAGGGIESLSDRLAQPAAASITIPEPDPSAEERPAAPTVPSPPKRAPRRAGNVKAEVKPAATTPSRPKTPGVFETRD